MLDLYVDADACPVKQEVYRVARRLSLRVFVVGARALAVPRDVDARAVAAGAGADAADDWIAQRIGPGDICVTADIPLAARCLARGAAALGPRGVPFTEDGIGEALATRELLQSLRDGGLVGSGPPPFHPRDRSTFLDQLDRLILAIRRRPG
jgi:hypothetical protein